MACICMKTSFINIFKVMLHHINVCIYYITKVAGSLPSPGNDLPHLCGVCSYTHHTMSRIWTESGEQSVLTPISLPCYM